MKDSFKGSLTWDPMKDSLRARLTQDPIEDSFKGSFGLGPYEGLFKGSFDLGPYEGLFEGLVWRRTLQVSKRDWFYRLRPKKYQKEIGFIDFVQNSSKKRLVL